MAYALRLSLYIYICLYHIDNPILLVGSDVKNGGEWRGFIVSSQMNQDIRFDRNVIDVPATPALQGPLV